MLHVQIGSKRCLLFGSHSSGILGISEICSFSVERKNLPISLPMVWPGTSPKDINKTNESANGIFKETEYSGNNFSGRYLINSLNRGGHTNLHKVWVLQSM